MTQNKNQNLTTTTLAIFSTSLPFWKSAKSLLPSTSMSSQSFPSSRLQRSTPSSLLTTTQPMHMNKTKYGVISGLSILIVLVPAILFLAYWRKRHINKHVIKPVEFELRQASSDTTVQNRQLPAIPEPESDNENLHDDANSYHQPATPEENHYHHIRDENVANIDNSGELTSEEEPSLASSHTDAQQGTIMSIYVVKPRIADTRL